MCTKKKFSESAARLFLKSIKESGRKRKKVRREKNCYLCKYCGWWHLTSQESKV